MARIVTIDDDEDVLFQLRFVLTRAGHEVFPLLRTDRIAHEVRRVSPDLVITDIVMPGVMGGGVYQLLRREIGPQLPIIVSSGTKLRIKGSEKDALLAYCPKPVDYEELLKLIEDLLRKRYETVGPLDSDLDDFCEEN
ncbi:MAG: response regulator [Candidatus Sumerlaeaceae bacterium]|nr:response regulator [Candidatus Sumerlaeaceae bacterium]